MYYKNYKNLEDTLKQFDDIIDEINNIGHTKFNRNDEWNTKSIEDKYNNMKILATELNFPTDETELNNDNNKINDKLNNIILGIKEEINTLNKLEQEIKIRETLNILNNQYKTYININEVTDDEINNLGKKIHELRQGLNILECPHCNGSLRIQGHKLLPSELHKINPSEIQENEKLLRELNSIKSKYVEKINLEKQIKSFKQLITSNGEYEKVDDILNKKIELNEKLRKYESLEIIKLPKYSSKFISRYLSYIEIKKSYDEFLKTNNIKKVVDAYEKLGNKLETSVNKEFNDIEREKMEFDENLYNMNETINKMEEYRNKIINIKNNLEKEKYNYNINNKKFDDEEIEYMRKKSQNDININNFMSIVTKINDYDKELSDKYNELKIYQNDIINDIDEQINSVTINIENSKQYLQKSMICDSLYERQTQLNVKRNKILRLYKDITTLGTFRQISIDLECKLLQSTVDRINVIMNDILEEIFEKSITVTLKLYKKIKSNKRIKPSVNLTVSYNGVEYDGVNMLSGGESDRISIAIIIAMNRISTSPFLLLDEAMKSINDSLRFKSIKSLRNILGDFKTIICVNHEDTEGNYDYVIPVGITE